MRVAAVVYGKRSRIVRRIVAADSLPELSHAVMCGDGEDLIICRPEQVVSPDGDGGRELPTLEDAMALVVAREGAAPENNRCLVIDDASGEIEAVVPADPHIDGIEGKTLYQHETAEPGWQVDATGEFAAPDTEAAP